MSDLDVELLKAISNKLNVLIMFQLENSEPDGVKTMTHKVKELLRLGLAPVDVAVIVGKPTSYVTAIKSKKS